jgi:hypothetical protein
MNNPSPFVDALLADQLVVQRLIRSCRADEEQRKIGKGSVDDSTAAAAATVAAAATTREAVAGSKSRSTTRDPNLTISYVIVLVMVAIAARVLIKFYV